MSLSREVGHEEQGCGGVAGRAPLLAISSPIPGDKRTFSGEELELVLFHCFTLINTN